MTDTEAKALARNLVLIATNKALPNHYRDYATGAAHYIEATEARHAAELREQAERFSEAVDAYSKLWSKRTPSRDEYNTHFAPFILPKPDPLVEVLNEAWDEVGRPAQANRLRAGLAARGYEVRKIGEAGE